MKKLFPQIFIKLFIVTFLPVIIANIFYYKSVKNEIKRYTKNLCFTRTDYAESILFNNFTSIENYANHIVKFISINPFFAKSILKTAFYTNKKILKILLVDTNFNILGGMDRFNPVEKDKKININKLKKFEIIKSYGEYRFVIVKKFNNYNIKNQPYKYLYLEISLKNMFQQLSTLSSKKFFYFILDKKENIVFHSDYNLVLADTKLNIPTNENRNFYGIWNVFNPVKNINEKFFLRIKYLHKYSMLIGVEIPYQSVYSQIQRLQNKMFISFVIIFLLLLIISFFIAKSIVTPVKKLQKISNEIKEGNFKHSVLTFPKNEIGELADNLKFMAENIEKYIANVNLEKNKLRKLFNTIQNGIYVVDKNYNLTMINDVELSYLEKKRENVLGRKCYEVLAKRNVKCVNCPIDNDKLNLKYGISLTELGFRKTCTRKFVNIDFVPFTQKENLVYIQDVTEVVESYNIIEEEKERFKVTLQSIGDGVIVTNNEGKILLMNKVAENAIGCNEHEIIGENIETVFEIYDERTNQRLKSPVKETLKTKKIVQLSNHAILYGKDGKQINIEDSSAPILNDKGKLLGVVLVFRDVTEKRQREEELIKVDKLETVGQLAGGIAHDFNNILTGIYGNISLARMFLDNKEKLNSLLEKVEFSLERAKNLTGQLLTFAKGGAPVKKLASIEKCIKESVDFVLTGSNIKVFYNIGKNLFAVEMDEGQISQVFQNLALNAKDAMKDGGTIEIFIQDKVIMEDDKSSEMLEAGNYVEIIFKDSGEGIDKKILSKIFDPFFTTKKKGSGLGLATCYSIISNHNGKIFVDSEKNKGTTFKIYLPAHSEHIDKKLIEEKFSNYDYQHSDKLKILLMDDNEEIRNLAKDIFEILNIDIDLAEEGKEAIELYKSKMNSKEKYDIVILDLTVPGGMGGKETIKELLNIDENIKAVVSSGYSTDPVIAKYKEYGFKYVLSKPYTVAEIKKMINVLEAE